MKNYLAFYFDVFYPEGGFEDFIGDFEDIELAKNAIFEKAKTERNLLPDVFWEYVRAHIVDISKREIIWKK